jgi:hypothetical protein
MREFVTERGPWEVANNMLLDQPFSEVAVRYFDAQEPGYMPAIDALAEQVYAQATPAFLANKGAPVLIPIPVAAHHEQGYIGRTLRQYAPQSWKSYHTQLYCNWPKGTDSKRVDATLEAVTTFQSENPDVPVAYFAEEVEPGTPIGRLSKTNWDVGLAALQGSSRMDDVLVLSHNADITKLNIGHIGNMYQAFVAPSELPITLVWPVLTRARSNGILPNMDSVIAWNDFQMIVSGNHFELGAGISARAYMAAGGYQTHLKQAESLDLIRRIHQGAYGPHPGIRTAPDARIVTSARREYYKLEQLKSPDYFWDEEFGTEEGYRTMGVEEFHDLPASMRDSMIHDIAFIGHFAVFDRLVNKGVQQGLLPEHALARARRLLRNVVQNLGGEFPPHYYENRG